MFRWGIPLFLLNFLPIAWLNIHMFQTTQLGVLGVDFLFVLAGSLLYGWLLDAVPWRRTRKVLIGLSFLVCGLLFGLEAFTIWVYQAPVGAGIVTAILQTNPHEAVEYLRMYVGWKGALLLILLAVVGAAGWRCAHRADVHLQQPPFSMPRWIPVLLAILCGACGWGLWTQYHSFVVNDNLDIPVVRVALASDTAITNIRAYEELEQEASADVTITENGSEVPYVVFILGESTTRDRMHLYGYPLDNTPNLDELAAKGDIAVYRDAIAPASATVAVLRRLFTFSDLEAEQPWYTYNNLIDVMKAAGYRTYWLSNQESSGIWGNVAQLFARRADVTRFAQLRESHEDNGSLDEMLFPLVDEALENPAEKNFYVVHLMGTHGQYYMRYPYLFSKFTPADVPAPQDALPDDRRLEVAQYANAIYYNDFVVSSIMGKFQDKEAIVIYLPDHGEDLYDNGSSFAGHVEENPTRPTCDVPLIFWASPAYRAHHPEKWQVICAAVNRPYMTDDMIHTLLDLLDIRTPEYNPAKSVINAAFDAARHRVVHGKDYDTEIR